MHPIIKRHYLLFFCLVFLGILPFFWLKPGWIDIGGDSSRLYFYDPINYLKSFALYGVEPTSTGPEQIGYYLIPFTLLLSGIKSFIPSPYLLITLFNSFTLVVSFLSVYLIVVLLLTDNIKKKSTELIRIIAIVSGFFYLFSPILTPNGWDKALIVHNQVFLNPLIFYLLLKYIHVKKKVYIYCVLIIMFIFAANFSLSPYFFSFYLFTGLFFLLYSLYVRRERVLIKDILLFGGLFVLLNIYHLYPLIRNVLTPGSSFNESTFSAVGKLNRGQAYFRSIADSTVITKNIIGIAQGGVSLPFKTSVLWFVFPSLIIVSMMFYKKALQTLESKRTYFLLLLFYLLTLFAVSAKITNSGFSFYYWLFNVPGFAMFRNYVGQFSFVYVFYFSLLIAYLLYIATSIMKKRKQYIFLGFVFLIVIIGALPFIRGDMINLILNKGNPYEVSVPIKMDPEYEKLLEYVRSMPVDAKFISFPYSDVGWQMFSGEKGGMYQGPPTLSYLGGKRDFAGLDSLSPYTKYFLALMDDGNYQDLYKLFSILNIHYIFYNSDPQIYDNAFPSFPYDNVRNFLPKTQEEYKLLMSEMSLEKEISFNSDMYTIYSLDDKYKLPHIFPASDILYFPEELDKKEVSIPISLSWPTANTVFIDRNRLKSDDQALFEYADTVYIANNRSELLEYLNKRKEYEVLPYASQRLSSPLYSFVVRKEKKELEDLHGKDFDAYLDRGVFMAFKRVEELRKWKDEIPIKGNVISMSNFKSSWKEPETWIFSRARNYNSWEISLLRYQLQMEKLINDIKSDPSSNYSEVTNKLKIRKDLQYHNTLILDAIDKAEGISLEDKQYLYLLSLENYKYLMSMLNLEISDNISIPYVIDSISDSGSYDVKLSTRELDGVNYSSINMSVNGTFVLLVDGQNDNQWLSFDQVNLQQGDTVNIDFSISDPINIVSQNNWQNINDVSVSGKITQMEITENSIPIKEGIFMPIPELESNTYYLISFEYLTNNHEFNVKVYNNIDYIPANSLNPGANITYASLLSEDFIASSEMRDYKTIVRSDDIPSEGIIQIIKGVNPRYFAVDPPTGEPSIQIRNVSVRKIPNPNVVLTYKSEKTLQTPQISFSKINRTKYRVDIKGATDPYALVFLDAYSPAWKLYMLDDAHMKQTIEGKLKLVTGRMFTFLLSVLFPEKNLYIDQETIASYFGGLINEKMHTNVFLDSRSFETAGYEPIAEYDHVKVYGYANAWYIAPDDVSDIENYTFVLEMTSQKQFYVLFFIAFLTAISISSYILYITGRHLWQKFRT